MALTQRERYIVIGVGSVLGLFLLDYFAFGPWSEKHESLIKAQQVTQEKLDDAKKLFRKHSAAQKVMNSMVADGLKSDKSEAEYQIVSSVRQWAQESGLVPASIKPDPATSDNKNFVKVNVRFTATGSTASVSRMLHRLETAKLPVRVTEVQISSRREGTDDLQLVMTVTTICPVPDAAPKKDDKTRTTVTSVASVRGDHS